MGKNFKQNVLSLFLSWILESSWETQIIGLWSQLKGIEFGLL